MVSFQGIITKGIVNAELQFEKMGYLSTNVSNYTTPGYKCVRFEQILDENGYLRGVARKDYTTGPLQHTGNLFDVAVNGIGFIPVTSPTGEVAYSRDGSLKLDKDGYLTTNDGYLVGDGIKLPSNYKEFKIKDNGEVMVYMYDKADPEYAGTIPLVNFLNVEGLKAGDNNKYYVTNESGEPVLLTSHRNFRQGKIERPNIDMMNEVNTLLRLNASMLASFEVMKAVNSMYNKAVTINQ